ncbi:hypothetical protein QJS66_03825 [Kocuria rhizophila]|nr:hypothetical protein QJS66_03825 [Kocuria rhizophila]
MATVSQTSRQQILAHRLAKRDVRVIAERGAVGGGSRGGVRPASAAAPDLVYMGSFTPYRRGDPAGHRHLPGHTLHLLCASPPRAAPNSGPVPAGARVVFQAASQCASCCPACAALVTASRAGGLRPAARGKPSPRVRPCVCSSCQDARGRRGRRRLRPGGQQRRLRRPGAPARGPGLARQRVLAGLERIREHVGELRAGPAGPRTRAAPARLNAGEMARGFTRGTLVPAGPHPAADSHSRGTATRKPPPRTAGLAGWLGAGRDVAAHVRRARAPAGPRPGLLRARRRE